MKEFFIVITLLGAFYLGGYVHDVDLVHQCNSRAYLRFWSESGRAKCDFIERKLPSKEAQNVAKPL